MGNTGAAAGRGLSQPEKQGGIPAKDWRRCYCCAGSTTTSLCYCWLPADPDRSHHISRKQLKIVWRSAEQQHPAAGKERQQDSSERTKLFISLLLHPQVQQCFQSTHQDASFLVVFIWTAHVNTLLEKQMAFLIITRLCCVPKPVVQTDSDVDGAGTAASTATHLAANQASALPN